MDTSANRKERGRSRTRRVAGILLSCLLFGALPVFSSGKAVLEYQVKSAYLYNFSKFVRWPETVLDATQRNLTICVIGHADMHEYLYTLDDRPAIGHLLKVSFRNIDTGLDGCHMAYIGENSRLQTSAILEWCHRNHVLTIGDQPGFIELGGIIGFVLIDDHVRLVISRSAVLASGLEISAKLLELAQVVE